jgi:hypothetical protein
METSLGTIKWKSYGSILYEGPIFLGTHSAATIVKMGAFAFT